MEKNTAAVAKDMQDYVAMVLIWYATQATGDTNPALQEEMMAALRKIEEQLDKVK